MLLNISTKFNQHQLMSSSPNSTSTSTQHQETCMCSSKNCQGEMVVQKFVWHVRPKGKDLAKGHRPYDDFLEIGFCRHHLQILQNNYGVPELYGWDYWEAVDGLRLDTIE